MKIRLFGIGYVGSVSAACLARDGHHVTAIDNNPTKIEALNRGQALFVEPGLDALVRSGVDGGGLRAVLSTEDDWEDADLSIICVGTPAMSEGALDLSVVERVAGTIAETMKRSRKFGVVVIRSTLTPGSIVNRIAPLMEQASGLQAGAGFGLAYYPEFLREGSAICDYDNPSHAVVAATEVQTLARVAALQPRLANSPTRLDFTEAEAVKMVNNVWRAMKVSFANEIGGVLGVCGVDSHRVMSSVLQDPLSRYSDYLRPGFAFGGSCLPKDLGAFSALGAARGHPTPMLNAAVQANRAVVERAVSIIEATGGRRVSIFGAAFKAGTDDLRESPYIELARRLIDKGYDVRLFDPAVHTKRLTGANLAYAMERLPPLQSLLCDTLEAAVQHGEVLLLGHADLGAAALDLADKTQRIIDLVRVRPDLRTGGDYVGLSW